MKYIKCKGRDGIEEIFIYNMKYNSIEKTWIFLVYSITCNTDEFFEFQVKEVNKTTVKVIMMHHHNDSAYIAKGISEKMIEEAQKVLGREVISSTNSKEHKKFKNEYITEGAIKVWKRLERIGKAIWDDGNKVFRYKC
jgi:hypothetical protein